MNESELQMKFSIFEQQIMQIQQQLQILEETILDLSRLNNDLDELKGKIGKEILSQVGRGIFVKTNLISEELIVDVGDKNFVKKSIPETKKIISEQIEKLNISRDNLEQELKKINSELTKLILEYQEEHEHEHTHECDCDEDCDCSDEECKCGHKH
ncbi:MAG: prefoldin subunit alpha [Candidatus Pacearchaeota archaeon]|jgi:prefoldin alpha subunit